MKVQSTFRLRAVFFTLLGIFIILVSYFSVAVSMNIKRPLFPFMAILAIVFFLLGLTLIFLTLRQKVESKLKKFLILTGASASCFFISVVLHNFVYGLFIYFFGNDFWDKIGFGDEPFFFILGLIVCPIVFLIGLVGSLVLFYKERRRYFL